MKHEFEVRTPSHACLVNITAQVARLVPESNIKDGLCCVFIPHTTAGITINENADPTVRSDILRRLDKIVPWDDHYEHSEGNAAAHIKVSMLGTSETILVEDGKLQLGTWQGIYLAEFDGPRTRRVWVQFMPE
jgi:secondary thiamine-phosphate synthase enzyme